LITLAEITDVTGEPGNFQVEVTKRPRFVDTEKCIACGLCAEKCPKKVDDEYNEKISRRKAVYIPYAQAVPQKYAIDADNCIYLKSGKCGACEKFCPAGAINFEDKPQTVNLNVGAIILSPGFATFDPTGIRTWGYGEFQNVITSMEMERILSASGPTEGHLVRPSDKKEVKRIAFIQCVGSRDLNKSRNGYCSSVCCTYAIKQAMMAKDHVKDLEASIFFMDMRTHGKEFERYYERAKGLGIEFKRCRVHSLEPVSETSDIYFRYIDDCGRQLETQYDLVVLSVGLCTPPSAMELAYHAGVELNENRFVESSSFDPVATSRPGVFSCGAFSGPKDIPQTVMEASAAAADATRLLSGARNSLTRTKEFPPEIEVASDEVRIGVFICHCGTNIAGVIDVERLARYAETLPSVAHVGRNLFTCSQDTQDIIKNAIKEKRLNRVVVAACTPRTHEPLFRETLKSAGLNEYLFDMANIRNQDSWVHAAEPERATEKAMDLVRMSVAKVGLMTPLPAISVPVNQAALVIGGGISGMVAALELADHGFHVSLVEKVSVLGGQARHLFRTWKGELIEPALQELDARVRSNPRISLHLESTVGSAEGFVGNFKSTIVRGKDSSVVEHGATIIASGGQGYVPEGEYLFGTSSRVFTAIEFDKLRMVGDRRMKEAKNYVFIQCVGSRCEERMYCSRVCCTHSVQAAIELKESKPAGEVFVLYRDMRTYGQREELYRKAREKGVVFIHYEAHQKPKVRPLEPRQLEVEVFDHILHEPLRIVTDIVVLATAITPNAATAELADIYKLPVDTDGFFQEAHAKLRPVDFAADGIFMAGLAHCPKPVEESIAQAKAAAGRAVSVLAGSSIDLEATKATVVKERCDGCAMCLDVCPYKAISLVSEEAAGGKRNARVEVNLAQCKGCGLCQATCPKDGIYVAGFSLEQIAAQIEAALAG
jgi:heterodisulfide reductase subunit A